MKMEELKETSAATPGEERLAARVAALERRSGRLRIANLLLAVAAGCFLLLGQDKPRERCVDSECFLLTTPMGQTAVRVGLNAGLPALELFDADGRPRARLGLEDGECPALELIDRDGRSRFAIRLYPDGSPHLELDGSPSSFGE
jgi:hypothetical protein